MFFGLFCFQSHFRCCCVNSLEACCSSHVPSWTPSTGGPGGIGSIGKGGGGGGGGGGEDDDDDAGDASSNQGGFAWKGWDDRVKADPDFVYKVLVEQIIGVGASVIGDMAGRPNWGLNELDFVFATLVVGSIVNFSLMYLLAPTASAAAGAGARAGIVQKIFGDQYLLKMGAPGGHMFQPGFGVSKRAINFVYKGAVFAFIGMCAGLVGTATSNGLLTLRKKMDPTFKPQNTPPNVLANASCWALHMGVSSNLRYQLLNGMDMLLVPVLPNSVFRGITSVVRGLNNALGGISFVFLAKVLGVQKAAQPTPIAANNGGGKKKKR